MSKFKTLVTAGTRPNFVKVAPLIKVLKRKPGIECVFIHTGQHYDDVMSQAFLRDLDLPEPDLCLKVGSGSHAQQTARVMERFESVVCEHKPHVVLVVGDVNSTVACALVTAKVEYANKFATNQPGGARRPLLAHVEAGLRSFDRAMPEEINRRITDAISDLLFTTEESGNINLVQEGIRREKIFFVGNVMIDSLLQQVSRARSSTVRERLGLADRAYALLTLHRPSNVDSRETILLLLRTMEGISCRVPVIFPAHPRTVARLREFDILDRFVWVGDGAQVALRGGLNILPALGYLDFLNLMSNARVVLTDSGGIQEESTILGVPCLTLRENTERPVTVSHGTNVLVGSDPQQILMGFEAALAGPVAPRRTPPLWDGKAAERIVEVLEGVFR